MGLGSNLNRSRCSWRLLPHSVHKLEERIFVPALLAWRRVREMAAQAIDHVVNLIDELEARALAELTSDVNRVRNRVEGQAIGPTKGLAKEGCAIEDDQGNRCGLEDICPCLPVHGLGQSSRW